MTSYFVCFHFVSFLLHCCCWFSVFVHLCVCLSSQVQFSVCQRYSDVASSTSMLSHPSVSPVPNVFFLLTLPHSPTHSLPLSFSLSLSVLLTPTLSYSLWRPSFTDRLYDCCGGGAPRPLDSAEPGSAACIASCCPSQHDLSVMSKKRIDALCPRDLSVGHHSGGSILSTTKPISGFGRVTSDGFELCWR